MQPNDNQPIHPQPQGVNAAGVDNSVHNQFGNAPQTEQGNTPGVNIPHGTAVDPNIPAENTPADDPVAQVLANITPERLDAFKKNLAFMWAESIDMFGMPFDTILNQVFRNAMQQGLPAAGHMIDYGMGAGFVPDKKVLTEWIDAYFARTLPQMAPKGMPEA